MNDYRREANQVAKEASWTIWRFLPIFLIVIFILALLGFGLRSCGLLGETVVERKVFEASYQRTAAIKAQIANDEAVLEEIKIMLTNPSLDESTRTNLNAQAAAARMRIRTARAQE